MDDDLHRRIDELVAEEHALRTAGHDVTDEDRARLAALEVSLDRVWDLLRQRQARRDVGSDPSLAEERSANTVEGYLG
ncbi:MAG: hypothetical protein JWP14_3199 [Frankiales bacterium]|jgi:hypothetical protein|nr:hypothetical protein [Frankiales bacterium]